MPCHLVEFSPFWRMPSVWWRFELYMSQIMEQFKPVIHIDILEGPQGTTAPRLIKLCKRTFRVHKKHVTPPSFRVLQPDLRPAVR